MEKNSFIPRNLSNDDFINLGFGIKLRLRDAPFILIGGYFGYSINLCLTNQLLQIISICLSVVSSYGLSKIKYEDQEISEFLKNGSIYGSRKIKYEIRRRNLNDKSKGTISNGIKSKCDEYSF